MQTKERFLLTQEVERKRERKKQTNFMIYLFTDVLKVTVSA